QTGDLTGVGSNSFFISPIHVPPNAATFTVTAQWLGGGPTALSRASKDNGNTNNGGWSFGATTNGFSPLTLTSAPTVFTATRAFTPALRGSGTNNFVSNFVAVCAISNYPAIDSFNRLRGVAPGCNWAAAKVFNDSGHGFVG